MDQFIAGIITTCGVIGLAEIVRRINNARAARQHEIDTLETKVINLEYDVLANRQLIERIEADSNKEHKKFRKSFETAGDTIRLVHTDVALLSNHLGLMIASPSPCDRRVVVVPTSAKDARIS